MTHMKKLMENKMLVGATILMLGAASALADEMSKDQHMNSDPGEYYRANEFSVDGFATGSIGRYTIDNLSGARIRQNTDLGAGLGLNYFFCRYVGIGGDVYSENTTGSFVDSASGNLILRLPLGQSGFAPYVLGGGGHQWDMMKASFGQAGVGLEYRFTPNVGVIVDARMVWPEQTKYYGVVRLGMRFAF